jgi:hypothetical protein
MNQLIEGYKTGLGKQTHTDHKWKNKDLNF